MAGNPAANGGLGSVGGGSGVAGGFGAAKAAMVAGALGLAGAGALGAAAAGPALYSLLSPAPISAPLEQPATGPGILAALPGPDMLMPLQTTPDSPNIPGGPTPLVPTPLGPTPQGPTPQAPGGETIGETATVPEPATIWVLAAGIALALGVRPLRRMTRR